MNENSTNEVKYCVAAFLDLQGFSQHLEVGSDIRTQIGQQAIRRLETLEDALKFLDEESQNLFFSLPKKRINDSLILTIDLNDALRPEIGETYRAGLSEAGWEKFYDIKSTRLDRFPNERGDSTEIFNEKYENKRTEYTLPLLKFLGLVARLHQRINIKERASHFPGVKTIISTGFRRRFFERDSSEDYFSANFAFSNAYIAQQSLKGSRLFVDNHILEMMDANMRVKNIAKLACLFYNKPVFSPLNLSDPDKVFSESSIEKVLLFRKTFWFRSVNPNPLTYLQFVDDLEGRKDMYDFIIKNITEESIDGKIKKGDHFNILKLPYDMGKEMCERLERDIQERYPPVTIRCFGCGAAVEAEWKFCVECRIDLLS